MKAFIITLSILVLITAGGCGGSSSTTSTTPIAFLYTIGPSANSIQQFSANSTGALTSLGVASVGTVPIPTSMVLHTTKNFVYVTNSTSNVVSGFTLNHTTGILTPIGTALPPTPTGTAPIGVGVNSGGQFLFVLNQGTVTPAAAASISVFSIDTTRGILTEITGSPFTFASLTAGNVRSMVVSPNAGFLYVANGPLGNISEFAIGAGGTLTELGSSPFAAGTNIAGMAIDAKGQFLFAADSAANKVVALNITSGVLSTVAGSPFAAGTQPLAVAVDSTSSFVYSANHGSNDVSAFKITAGALTQVAGSPYATGVSGVATPSQPAFVTVDTTNGFVYVANQGTGTVAAFALKSSDGTLTLVSGSPFGVTAPTWLLSAK
jgi:6-phosphogluconolactonase (cycloisomerase 2 family)